MFGFVKRFFLRLFGTENKKPEIPQKVIIYADPFFRGAMVGDGVKKRKPNALFKLEELTAWEHRKSTNDNCVMKWVNDVLLPELEKGALDPLVVWRRNGRNYVIDGHHRLIAYKKAGWSKEVPAIVVENDEIIMTDWTPGKGFPHP